MLLHKILSQNIAPLIEELVHFTGNSAQTNSQPVTHKKSGSSQ